jgi:hypothetical protein
MMLHAETDVLQGSAPSDQDILTACVRFRDALDAIDPQLWSRIYIDHFPRGACGHCAELLGRFLTQEFAIAPEYVCAVFYNEDGSRDTSHAWLEWNGLVIDISGDQFGWDRVIVSRSSALHNTGEIEIRNPLTSDARWWAEQCGSVWTASLVFLA